MKILMKHPDFADEANVEPDAVTIWEAAGWVAVDEKKEAKK